jgi:trans-2-enoyl-CoA reductase
MSRSHAAGGSLVTSGGMSRRPVQVPTGRLIFNNISLHGFWLSRWIDENPKRERQDMINSLCDLIRKGKLTTWIEPSKFSNFSSALQRSSEGFRNAKVVLMMQE